MSTTTVRSEADRARPSRRNAPLWATQVLLAAVSVAAAVLKPATRSRRGRHRFGVQLWVLLHARALLDGPGTAASSASPGEDDGRRLAGRRSGSQLEVS